MGAYEAQVQSAVHSFAQPCPICAFSHAELLGQGFYDITPGLDGGVLKGPTTQAAARPGGEAAAKAAAEEALAAAR